MAAADESLLATAEEHPAAPSQSAAPSPAATKTPARDVGASGAAERKLFVGGLSYSTTTNGLHSFFARFGRIHEAVVISERSTGKSKGYGFVTFETQESAERALKDPTPVIDGRKTNCNLAALGAKKDASSSRKRRGRAYHGPPSQGHGAQAAYGPQDLSYANMPPHQQQALLQQQAMFYGHPMIVAGPGGQYFMPYWPPQGFGPLSAGPDAAPMVQPDGVEPPPAHACGGQAPPFFYPMAAGAYSDVDATYHLQQSMSGMSLHAADGPLEAEHDQRARRLTNGSFHSTDTSSGNLTPDGSNESLMMSSPPKGSTSEAVRRLQPPLPPTLLPERPEIEGSLRV